MLLFFGSKKVEKIHCHNVFYTKKSNICNKKIRVNNDILNITYKSIIGSFLDYDIASKLTSIMQCYCVMNLIPIMKIWNLQGHNKLL